MLARSLQARESPLRHKTTDPLTWFPLELEVFLFCQPIRVTFSLNPRIHPLLGFCAYFEDAGSYPVNIIL